MYYDWKPYVPVAQRRANAAKAMQARAKKGMKIEPVTIDGRAIARSFWGKRWCDAMESQADFANRLPRGRTYVRNGSVAHLAVEKGAVTAVVSGSDLYDVNITVRPVSPARWKDIRDAVGRESLSALDLLQGKLSDASMKLLTEPGRGLIPEDGDFTLRCSCPDYASLCKHVAAVLYGVGHRLDQRPELLFTLRGVKHTDLVVEASAALTKAKAPDTSLSDDDAALSALFGIDLTDAPAPTPAPAPPAQRGATAPRGRRSSTPVAAPAKPAAPKPTPPKPATPEPAVTALPKGPLTAAQLRAMGYTATRVKRLVDDGALERVGFGWYRFLRSP